MVKLLLDNGAMVDSQSYNGGTPLMRSIESSQREIVKLLMERGYFSYHAPVVLQIKIMV